MLIVAPASHMVSAAAELRFGVEVAVILLPR